jgi:hypothetical protein
MDGIIALFKRFLPFLFASWLVASLIDGGVEGGTIIARVLAFFLILNLAYVIGYEACKAAIDRHVEILWDKTGLDKTLLTTVFSGTEIDEQNMASAIVKNAVASISVLTKEKLPSTGQIKAKAGFLKSGKLTGAAIEAIWLESDLKETLFESFGRREKSLEERLREVAS